MTHMTRRVRKPCKRDRNLIGDELYLRSQPGVTDNPDPQIDIPGDQRPRHDGKPLPPSKTAGQHNVIVADHRRMFRGWHLIKVVTCLAVLLLAACSSEVTLPLPGTNGITIAVADLPDLPSPQQFYTITWFGQTDSAAPPGTVGNSQAWQTQTFAPSDGPTFTFQTLGPLTPGLWSLNILVTQGQTGESIVYGSCQQQIYASVFTKVTAKVHAGMPDTLKCTSPVGGFPPTRPLPKR